MSFFYYALIQVFGYVIDMGGFLFLTHVLLCPTITAHLLGRTAAGFFAFSAHRNITFRGEQENNKKTQAWRYLSLCIINLPVSALLLILWLYVLPNAIIAKFTADVSCVFINYLISKHFIFGKRVKVSWY